MAIEALCPHCGLPLSPGSDAETTSGEYPGAPDPRTVKLLGSGSNDDTFAASRFGRKAESDEPDPILGAFIAPTDRTSMATSVETVEIASFPAINLASSAPTDSFEASDDLGTPEPDDDAPSRSTSWPLVLLGSYASALTLALAWTLMNPKNREMPAASEKSPPIESRTDPGLLAARSRQIEPPGPIPDDRIARLGQTFRVGSLEVTPIDVKREDVTLRRSNLEGQPETRTGGRGALVLRLRLKNVSRETVFAPIDPAFVRERGRDLIDSFIESTEGGRIYPFPLAVESEWSIVGQDCADLRPGETRVVVVASAPEVPVEIQGPLTWRVRLRTGIDRTEVIGVRWLDPPSKP